MSQMHSTLQLVDLASFGLLTLVIVVLGCSLSQLFGEILPDTVEKSVHDKPSKVMTFATEIITDHILVTHVVRRQAIDYVNEDCPMTSYS